MQKLKKQHVFQLTKESPKICHPHYSMTLLYPEFHQGETLVEVGGGGILLIYLREKSLSRIDQELV
jgi:hypothetical protein